MPEQAAGRRSRAGRPRRAGRLLVVLPSVVLAVALPAVPAAAAAPAAYGTPTTRCEITDPRLPELSGLATAGDALLAMDDGGDQVQVFVLDASCAVAEVRTADVDPYDPEDMALGADGTIWIEDAGDNRQERATVAMIGLRPDGSTTVTRLTYPDGAHDTESLLLAPDGTPYLVTKEVLGASSVYRPDAPLVDGETQPMSKVADLGFILTGTAGGPVGRAGQLLATGGAVSGDGALLALRTYTDAYVWPLSGSDVAGALRGKPVRVPLPPSPQGEAISFAANNRDLVVSGEGLPATVTVVPAAEGLAAATTGAAASAAPAGGRDTGERVSPVTAGVVAVVAATGLVWLVGRWRRRKA